MKSKPTKANQTLLIFKIFKKLTACYNYKKIPVATRQQLAETIPLPCRWNWHSVIMGEWRVHRLKFSHTAK